MNSTEEALVDDYLRRLEQAGYALPPERPAELVLEIRDHIEEARAAAGGRTDEAWTRSLLDRMGTPDEIVAAATEGDPGAPHSWTPPQPVFVERRPGAGTSSPLCCCSPSGRSSRFSGGWPEPFCCGPRGAGAPGRSCSGPSRPGRAIHRGVRCRVAPRTGCSRARSGPRRATTRPTSSKARPRAAGSPPSRGGHPPAALRAHRSDRHRGLALREGQGPCRSRATGAGARRAASGWLTMGRARDRCGRPTRGWSVRAAVHRADHRSRARLDVVGLDVDREGRCDGYRVDRPAGSHRSRCRLRRRVTWRHTTCLPSMGGSR